MKKITIQCCAVALLLASTVSAQEYKVADGTPPMVPQQTEFWSPLVPVVTPGNAGLDIMIPPPSDAIVLFDGKDLSAWINEYDSLAPEWKIDPVAKTATITRGSIITKENFGDCQFHIEFRTPVGMKGKSQQRGNSGVTFQYFYEVQILDSYENPTYVNGQAASIYKQFPPLVNVTNKPGQWNVYDIIFMSPRFNDKGAYITPPRITVIHNGVVVQNNVTLHGTTEYIGIPRTVVHGDGPIHLQDHGDGDALAFRNIWLRKL